MDSILHDKDIREPLFDYFEGLYGKARFFEEKQMGQSRADVVMVIDGAVVGIEIKSDADTYARLKRQVMDYNRFFDYNYVVVGSTHAAHISEYVPESWGIVSVEQAEDGIDFYMVRKCSENPFMEPLRKLSILWRPELAHIQELNKMPVYKARSKAFVIEKINEMIPEETLRFQISEELFERDYTKIADEIYQYRKANNPNKRIRKKTKKYKRIKKTDRIL